MGKDDNNPADQSAPTENELEQHHEPVDADSTDLREITESDANNPVNDEDPFKAYAETNEVSDDSEQAAFPPLVIPAEKSRSKLASIFRPHSKRGKTILGLVIFAILLGAASAGYMLTRGEEKSISDQNSNATQSQAVTPTPTDEIEATPVPEQTIFETTNERVTDITLYDEYIEAPNDPFFIDNSYVTLNCVIIANSSDCEEWVEYSEIKNYNIGKMSDGSKLLLSRSPNKAWGGFDEYLYSKSADGKITNYYIGDFNYLAQNTDSLMAFKKATHEGMIINTSKYFPILYDFPQESMAGGQKIKVAYDQMTWSFLAGGIEELAGSHENRGSVVKLGEKDGLTFYSATIRKENGFDVKTYYGVRNNMFAYMYVSAGEIASATEPIAIKWSEGETQVVSSYVSAAQGCGSSYSYLAAQNLDKNKLPIVGKTPGGQTVYGLEESSILAQSIYKDDYQVGFDSPMVDPSFKDLSFADFYKKHAFILVEDGNKELVVFLRSEMFVRGGCGKPVIYLYPQSPTLVDVSVGADVAISDPFYPIGGWKNVLALPSGSLMYKSGQYESLFWEGYGHGEYPDISNQGVVVPASEVVATVHRQLAAQGLNQKESADFMEFWEPRFPKSGYVRLSWLSKKQLDSLAPLTVTPLPDTTIRVFLEFEYLPEYKALTPQQFTSPQRNGFTLVEWGGLLSQGLSPVKPE